jgi:hemerythrin
MPFTEWNPTMSVGVPEFDAQHKQWFEFINTLHAALKDGEGPEVINRLLGEILGFARMHFGCEERYLAERGYPGLDAHKVLHDEFIARLETLSAGGASLRLSVETFQAIRQWLTLHVAQADWEYGAFLRAQGLVEHVPA